MEVPYIFRMRQAQLNVVHTERVSRPLPSLPTTAIPMDPNGKTTHVALTVSADIYIVPTPSRTPSNPSPRESFISLQTTDADNIAGALEHVQRPAGTKSPSVMIQYRQILVHSLDTRDDSNGQEITNANTTIRISPFNADAYDRNKHKKNTRQRAHKIPNTQHT